MTNDEFTPEELAIIDRLQNAPQSQLSSSQVDAIRDSLFQELDAHVDLGAQPTQSWLSAQLIMIMGVVVVLIVIVAFVLINLISTGDDTPEIVPQLSTTPMPTASIIPSETSVAEVIVPTETLTITATPTPESSATSVSTETTISEPSATNTSTETVIPEPSATTASTETATPLPAPTQAVSEIQPTSNNLTTTQLVGEIEAIVGDVLSISGLQVDISTSDTAVTDLQIGMTVSVSGTVQNGVIVATTVVIIAVPEETSVQSTETTSPTTATPPPDDTTTSDVPIIVIEGPVQSINIDFITIFDVDIQIDGADPVLNEIRLGDIIRVEGETQLEGDTIIIVAVNITIIQVQAITIIDPNAPQPNLGGLPANCRMTPRGRITCRSRRTNR